LDGLTARLASRNANKARELEHLLPEWRIEPLEADDYPAEDGTTYYENARGKALFGRTRAQPGEWALGEDSGIEVGALRGGPGVQSARSGGDDPVGWLLGELAGVDDRDARYVSARKSLLAHRCRAIRQCCQSRSQTKFSPHGKRCTRT